MIILEVKADHVSILKPLVFKMLFLITVMSLCSCGIFPPKWAKSVTQGHQAIASEYALSHQKFIFSDIIDTNALYVNEHEWSTTYSNGTFNDHNLLYGYFRFSNTGICAVGGYMSEKPVDSLINLGQTIGQYGFYTVQNDIVKVELYNFDHHIFEYWFLRPQENGDLFHYKTKGRPFATYTERWNFLYKKQPAKFTQPIVFPK